MKQKILMTLALLLTAVTGAWAEEKSETIPTTTSQKEYTGEHFKITTSKQNDGLGGLVVADLRNYAGGQVFFFIETLDGQNISKLDLQINDIEEASIDNLSLSSGTKSYDSNTKVLTITNVNDGFVQITLTEGDEFGTVTISSVTYYYEDSPAGPKVAWDAATKTGTFSMPGSDVVLTPIYAKAAAFATTGTEPEVKTLLPEAAEGVIAGTDAPLIAEGIVAFAGTSTEVTQGTVMYAVTAATANEAPALTAFSATVPTAKTVADDGAEVKVWYYIQGADTPDGETPTADNTFNDSEVSSLTVTVRSNKFDLALKAANANTIDATDASKGTVSVKVGDAAAEDKTKDITDGKLKAIKMGSEVKLNTKAGYKFRKVEVKKAGPGPLTYATTEGAVTRIKFNYSGNEYYADFTYSNGSFTRTGGSNGYTFSGSWTMKEENGVLTMTADYNEMSEQFIYFVCTFYVDTNEYTAKSTGIWNYSFKGIEVNGTDITSQLTKVK